MIGKTTETLAISPSASSNNRFSPQKTRNSICTLKIDNKLKCIQQRRWRYALILRASSLRVEPCPIPPHCVVCNGGVCIDSSTGRCVCAAVKQRTPLPLAAFGDGENGGGGTARRMSVIIAFEYGAEKIPGTPPGPAA